MARIQTYTVDTTLNSGDMIIGTDGAQGANYATKNFTVGDLRTFILEGVSGTSYTNDDVDAHLNVSSAESSQVLSWDGSDYTWVTQSSGSSFSGDYNDLTNTPTTITNEQITAISNNSNKTSFPGFGTEAGTALEGNTTLFSGNYNDLTNAPALFSGSYNDLTDQPTIPAGYTDADVDTHLNRSTATANQVLAWSGSDYDWVEQSGGISGTASSDASTTAITEIRTITQTEYDDITTQGGTPDSDIMYVII